MTQVIPDFSSVLPTIEPSKKEMLSIRTEGKKRFVRINSSSLSIIHSCPRKSFYSLHEELKSKSESPALTFGSAIHAALETFYARPKEERGFPSQFEDRAALMAFGTPPGEDHFLFDCIQAFIDKAEPLRGLPDTDKRSIPNGIWTLCHYFRDYIDDIYVTYVDDQGPFVERIFSLNIFDSDTLQIEIFGQIDFVLKHSGNGTIISGDHKTVSQLGSDFYNRIKPNHQYSCYILGCQEIFGISSDKFLVNGIQVKPRPKTSRGTPPSFVRQVTNRTPEDLAEFKLATIEAVNRYLTWLDTKNWPLGGVDACAMWGGCQYLDVCSAPENLRQNIIESKFVSVKDMA